MSETTQRVVAPTKKLRRLPEKGWVAGVCAGIAEYADVDAMVVRALYALGTLVTLVIPGLLAYVILWAVIPSSRTDGATAA